MKIEILGTGCAKCDKLYKAVEVIVSEKGIEAELVKVKELSQIMAYGVMSTPAFVIDGDVKSSGKVLSTEEIAALL